MINSPDRARLAAFDIDNTLTNTFLVLPVMKSERDSGLLDPGSYDEAVAHLNALRRKEVDYETAAHGVLMSHAQGLSGKKYDELKDHAHEFVGSHPELLRSFAAKIMKLLKPTHELVAVTAEPEYMASVVVALLGMDRALTSRYAAPAGTFTGEIDVSLAHRNEKRRVIGPMRPDIAFGDSAGDIEMLAHAHSAYCISPDDVLKQEAEKRNWEVFNGDQDERQIIASVRARYAN
ncbi:MAG TPA: haloacid dehalogenase-like hydrolase [Candidatus Saccharimonadales bacterium]|nr:haloacid dehalogenase-like hydrolase [Candidatus Saccharimonadales bacterium]